MIKTDFPYIGITGFMNRSQVSSALAVFPHQNIKHKLMVGVLASSKTIAGQANKWPHRYPQVAEISEIFLKYPLALNLIHYATDDKTTDSFRDQLELLVKIGGDALQGFQLNVAWPSLITIRDFRKQHPNKHLVLQIGNGAMRELSDDKMVVTPKYLADRISHYVPFIDYILIDMSGGHKKPFEPENAVPILQAISQRDFPVRLGIAGGLGPGKMEHLKPVAKIFSDISIDVEGGVRTPQPEDSMDMYMVPKYIQESVRILYPKLLI